jgi:aminopeptidase N
MQIVRISLCVILVFFVQEISAMRVDSFSISKTVLTLKIKNFAGKSISGSALHHVKLKVKTNKISLDLKQLTVDSIELGANRILFAQVGERVNITLDKIYNSSDSIDLNVHYHGKPAADPGGWGGFYFSGDYAFNLGVGFTVSPHSFGRAWFPCVDEFPMKSAYEFFIETDSNYLAACNGLLIDVQNIPMSKIWHYNEPVPMSAYLAAVSVSKYSIIGSSFTGLNNKFPLELFCKSADSNKVKASFIHLPNAISAFEKAFGPQPYSKVGYNFVPFNGGAMEHAGNITFPAVFADGTIKYEETMAHELSHHWWGDNVTCKTEGDMWLNEGWASYCEHFFNESVYGKAAYKQSILENHLFVLRFAHINDGQIFSMVNIPKENTYGNHVYKKGADVVHSLRGVLGDSMFFKGAKMYQSNYRLGNASTQDMESVFAWVAGTKGNAFFNHWVYEKGSPHVSISKQSHWGNGPYNLRVQTVQKPRFSNSISQNLPIEIFFFKDRKHFEKRTVEVMSVLDSFDFTFDFKPVYVCLDLDEKLSDAITDRIVNVSGSNAYDLPEALSKLYCKSFKDTALLRVEHHWVGPEKYRVKAPYMSDYRYYTLDGVWDEKDSLDFELTYDGRHGGANTNLGYLDHTLILKTEDSLTVLYRAFPGDYWRIWKDLQFAPGSKNDKQGKVIVKNATKGDYVLAMYDKSLAYKDVENELSNSWTIFPNPAQNSLKILFVDRFLLDRNAKYSVLDAAGRTVLKGKLDSDNNLNIDLSTLSEGTYQFCILFEDTQEKMHKTFVLARK